MAFTDLTTLSDVKAWLQTGDAFTTRDDALLTRLIGSASQYIQSWLNRDLALQDWTEVRDGTGGHRLQFAVIPVSAVLSLVIDGVVIPPAPPLSQQGWTAGYAFSPTQLILRDWYFTRRPLNVAMTYTAGYAMTPSDVTQACIELVALRYRERDRIGVVSKVLAGETVSYSQKDMSDAIKTLLNQFRMVAPV